MGEVFFFLSVLFCIALFCVARSLRKGQIKLKTSHAAFAEARDLAFETLRLGGEEYFRVRGKLASGGAWEMEYCRQEDESGLSVVWRTESVLAEIAVVIEPLAGPKLSWQNATAFVQTALDRRHEFVPGYCDLGGEVFGRYYRIRADVIEPARRLLEHRVEQALIEAAEEDFSALCVVGELCVTVRLESRSSEATVLERALALGEVLSDGATKL